MEFVIHWFWLVKLLAVGLVLGASYKAIVTHKFKSTLWNYIAIILAVIGLIMPIKIKPVTDNTNKIMDTQIVEKHKEIPPLIKDNSFKQAGNITGITKQDLK